jgi:hypothetical protein
MAAANYTVLREFVDYRRNIRFRPGMTFAGDDAQQDTLDFLANGLIGPFQTPAANVPISATAPYPAAG